MSSYAAQKGRTTQPTAAAPSAQAELTTAQEARADENKQFIREHMPEIIPTIRHLHAEGLIDGWRSIKNCNRISQK